jgi:predicted aspartyl protease
VITGVVTANGVPTIAWDLGGTTFRAIVDTGFNGDLELPEQLRALVRPRLLGQATSLLAGGVEIREDVYQVDFEFDGKSIAAEATFVSGNDILIGTGLLRAHRLSINFVSRTVRIQRVK